MYKNTTKNLVTKTKEKVATSTIKIIAFGDSLTAGYGVALDESYPSILEKTLQEENINAEVINMGVSGETTTAGLERVAFVLAQKPSLILLGLGANDMLRATSPNTAKANLKNIIEHFQKERVPLILLGMRSTASNGEIYGKEFNAIYVDLAHEYNLPLVPFFLEGVALHKELNTDDGIHPNKEGYEYIIKNNILPVLLPLLKGLF